MTPITQGPHETFNFKLLDDSEVRWEALGSSLVFHSIIIAALIIVPIVVTKQLRPEIDYDVTFLAPPAPRLETPPPVKWKIIEPRPTEQVAPPLQKPVIKQVEVKPPELPKKPRDLKTEELLVKADPLLPRPAPSKPEPPPGKPRAKVRTDVFSEGSSVPATTKLPAHLVQTGGFGDPNGIVGEGRKDKIATIASLGSFDLPVGPGVGNGTGGARGARGAVASAGFGNGVAIQGGGGSGNGGSGRGGVRQGAFADSRPTTDAPQSRRQAAVPKEVPVEIISKPRPEYTEEGRRLKIEGEVLVEALFTATGEVRVQRIIRGLGHGLDENAVRAARQIRFKPAQRDGQPVDSTAIVHVLFQLAY